jgi:hypothetical protein
VERISVYGPIILLVLFIGPRFGIDLIGWILNPAMTNLMLLLVGA